MAGGKPLQTRLCIAPPARHLHRLARTRQPRRLTGFQMQEPVQLLPAGSGGALLIKGSPLAGIGSCLWPHGTIQRKKTTPRHSPSVFRQGTGGSGLTTSRPPCASSAILRRKHLHTRNPATAGGLAFARQGLSCHCFGHFRFGSFFLPKMAAGGSQEPGAASWQRPSSTMANGEVTPGVGTGIGDAHGDAVWAFCCRFSARLRRRALRSEPSQHKPAARLVTASWLGHSTARRANTVSVLYEATICPNGRGSFHVRGGHQ